MLAYKLVANGIGGRTVEELNETMTVDEFLTWAAYMTIEPFGDDRADWRNAMSLAMQANMNRKKGSSAIPVHKFLLRFDNQIKPKRTMKDLEAALYARFLSMGGKPKQ